MSADSQSQALPAGSYRRLIQMTEQFQDSMSVALDAGEWTHDDLPADGDTCKAMTQKLKAAGAIRSVGTVIHEHKGEEYQANVWAWVDGVAEKLEDYRDGLDTFPCGHRAHVHHRDGRFGCQYCDQARDYDRELVEELVFA